MRNTTHKERNVGVTICMWIIIGAWMFPFYPLFVYAASSKPDIAAYGALHWPKIIHWENFADALEACNFPVAIKNSSIATIVGVLLSIAICSMAAYAIVRFHRYRICKILDILSLAIIMLPFQTVMFPLYKNLVKLGLLNNIYAYTIICTAFQMGFNIFLYSGFVNTIPVSLEESAMIDGCGAVKTFFRVVFPLLKPIHLTVATLTALAIWNDYQIALVVLSKSYAQTLPVAQQVFIGQTTSYLNYAAAACIVSVIPMFILYLFLQKYIIKGMTAGAVKG